MTRSGNILTNDRDNNHAFRLPLFALLLPLSMPEASAMPLPVAIGLFKAGEASWSRSSLLAFLRSAFPIISTLVASHFWNGFATKKPSAVNQVV